MRANPVVPRLKHLRLLVVVVGLSLLTGALLRLPVAHVEAGTATVGTCDETHLRTAITAAGSPGTVTFACNGVITLSSPLSVNQTLTLDATGQSVTLDGGGTVEVIDVVSGGSLTLINLTVAHGSAVSGGGIANDGTLTLTNSTVRSNTATNASILTFITLAPIRSAISGDTGALGGGIYNNGTMTLTNSTVTGNTAITASSILVFTTSAPTNSAISGASGALGGGIYNDGTATLSNSTISGNSAVIEAIVFAGALTPAHSAIDGGNGALGGGIFNDGTMTLTNSTISGNTAAIAGGGIYNVGTLRLINCTVSGNTASDSVGGIYNGATIVLINSIVAGNTAAGSATNAHADCSFPGGIFGASVTTNAHNAFGSGTGCTAGASDVTVSPATVFTAVLGPLAANGGPTQTHALLPGSPAIDLVPASGASCPTTDQRGVTRPQGPACDAGAFEVAVAPQPTQPTISAVQLSLVFTLSITVTGCGTIAPPSGTAEVGNFDVTATPCPGSAFLGWTGGPCDGTAKNPCNVNYLNNAPITAVFGPVLQGNNVLMGVQVEPTTGLCPGGTPVVLGATCP